MRKKNYSGHGHYLLLYRYENIQKQKTLQKVFRHYGFYIFLDQNYKKRHWIIIIYKYVLNIDRLLIDRHWNVLLFWFLIIKIQKFIIKIFYVSNSLILNESKYISLANLKHQFEPNQKTNFSSHRWFYVYYLYFFSISLGYFRNKSLKNIIINYSFIHILRSLGQQNKTKKKTKKKQPDYKKTTKFQKNLDLFACVYRHQQQTTTNVIKQQQMLIIIIIIRWWINEKHPHTHTHTHTLKNKITFFLLMMMMMNTPLFQKTNKQTNDFLWLFIIQIIIILITIIQNKKSKLNNLI